MRLEAPTAGAGAAAPACSPAGREVEVKLELASGAEHAAVRALLGAPSRRLQQVNLYFDTLDERWRAAGFSVRARQENGALELTLKGNRRMAGAFRECDEHTVRLPPAVFGALERGTAAVAPFLRALVAEKGVALPAGLDPAQLVPLGATRTTRELLRVPSISGAKLELDVTTYPGGKVVHEAELEVSSAHDRDAVMRALAELLARAGVPVRVSSVSKQSRFRELWRASRAALNCAGAAPKPAS